MKDNKSLQYIHDLFGIYIQHIQSLEVLKWKQSTRADTDYGSYRRVAGKRSLGSSGSTPKAPLANAQLLLQPFHQFPLEQVHRETYVKQEDVGGADGENGETCQHSREALLNSDRMTLSNFEAEEEPAIPFFAPRSLTMKRTPKAEAEPEWQVTSKRVNELPWLRLKRRRAGRG